MSGLWRSPLWVVWAVLLSVLAIPAAILLLRGKPFGVFHALDREHLQRVEAVRLDRASKYLLHRHRLRAKFPDLSGARLLPHGNGSNVSGSGLGTSSPGEGLCIGVISSVRPSGARYLPQTMALLLQRIGNATPRVLVFNVEVPATNHPDASGPPISDLVEVMAVPPLPAGADPETFQQGWALQTLVRLGCNWTVMLEDDVAVAEDFCPQLLAVLQQVPGDPCHVAFIKLFVPETNDGWSANLMDRLLLVSCSLAVGALCSGLLHHCLQPLSAPSRLLAAGTWSLSALLLFIVVGKQRLYPHLLRNRPTLVRLPSRSLLFSQAHVYPACGLLATAHHLMAQRSSTEFDVHMQLWSAKTGKATYGVYPNLVQHLGISSTHAQSTSALLLSLTFPSSTMPRTSP